MKYPNLVLNLLTLTLLVVFVIQGLLLLSSAFAQGEQVASQQQQKTQKQYDARQAERTSSYVSQQSTIRELTQQRPKEEEATAKPYDPRQILF